SDRREHRRGVRRAWASRRTEAAAPRRQPVSSAARAGTPLLPRARLQISRPTSETSWRCRTRSPGLRTDVAAPSAPATTPPPPEERSEQDGRNDQCTDDLGARPANVVGAAERPDEGDNAGADKPDSDEIEALRRAVGLG